MKITIDGAGRVVIPKKFRKKFHWGPNTELELIEEGGGLQLRVSRNESKLVEKDGVLVQQAGSGEWVDSTAFLNEWREGRSQQIKGL